MGRGSGAVFGPGAVGLWVVHSLTPSVSLTVGTALTARITSQTITHSLTHSRVPALTIPHTSHRHYHSHGPRYSPLAIHAIIFPLCRNVTTVGHCHSIQSTHHTIRSMVD